jgi:hypothetical protein
LGGSGRLSSQPTTTAEPINELGVSARAAVSHSRLSIQTLTLAMLLLLLLLLLLSCRCRACCST